MFLPAIFIVSAWLIPAGIKFGFDNLIPTFFFNFVHGRLTQEDITQAAPFYWYARWWIDTFRPGFNLFVLLVLLDFLKRNFNRKQVTLLMYIVGTFVLYSIAKNNVWWYMLPLIPAISLYIYLSLSFHLREKNFSLGQLALVVILSSLPIVYQSRTTFTLLYEIAIFVITLFILLNKRIFITNKYLIPISIIISLVFFLIHFPKPAPMYPETRDVGRYFSRLAGNKCLYVQGMPYEGVLYYSDTGEINFLSSDTKLSTDCTNYLITPDDIARSKLIFQSGKIRLYRI